MLNFQLTSEKKWKVTSTTSRFSSFIIINLLLLFSNAINCQNISSPSTDSITLNHIQKIGDSIVSLHVGKTFFENYYRFAPEYSLIKRDTLGNHLACAWMNNNIGKGTSYDLTYTIKGNTFSFEGIHVYLNRDGSEYLKTSKYLTIPKTVNGKSPTFITRKEAIAIAAQCGMKDTFELSFELILVPQKDSLSWVYRLQIIFDTPAKHPPGKDGELYFIQNFILVNPWTNKILSAKKMEVMQDKEEIPIDVTEKKPPE